MVSHLYVRKQLIDTIVELSNLPDREGAPFFDDGGRSLVELGMRYYEAQASNGEFLVTSPDLSAENPVAWFPLGHELVTWIEDGTGDDLWIFRGRVTDSQGGREVAIVDRETAWTINVEDGNCDLRGQGFTESWVRPEETDTERLYALFDYTLAGPASTATHFRESCHVLITGSAPHLAPDTNTVTMPARTYGPGTQPIDVVRDCADTAGKLYGVVIHHDFEDGGTGSHLCLLYIIPTDHTTFATDAKISDQLADWDPLDVSAPVWEPHWERGNGTIFGMQSLISGIVCIFNNEFAVFDEQPGSEDNYDYWVEAYHDGDSMTEAQATLRTAGILSNRAQTHVSNRISVIVQDNQVRRIGAGMSLEVKGIVTHPDDPATYQTRRIGEIRWEPRFDGSYWAHLDLERPPVVRAPSTGSAGGVNSRAISVIESAMLTNGNLIDNEIPTGTIDGANDTFTLANEPDPPESLHLYKNGIRQREGSGNDFVLTADTIVYEAASIPDPGDYHYADYRFGG